MSFQGNPDHERELIRATEKELEGSAQAHAEEPERPSDQGRLGRLIDQIRAALRRHDSA